MDNLVAWLDTVVISLGLHTTFVFDGNNTRIMGCYNPARNSLQNSVAQQISSVGAQAVTNGLSCGHILEVSGGPLELGQVVWCIL